MRIKHCIAALSVFLLAACGDPAPSSADRPGGVDNEAEQAWARQDGNVTAAEYHKGVNDFRECMRVAGYPTSEPLLSPVDSLTLLFDVTFPGGDVDKFNDRQDFCNESHMSLIEADYVAQHTQKMEPKLVTAAAACMQKKGFPATVKETTVGQFAKMAGNQMRVAMDCVSPAARKLYPDLPRELHVRW